MPGDPRVGGLIADGPREPLPSISIVTATYNRAGLIEEAIDGVLQQAYEGVIEHIVVDGASTDDTLSRLRNYPHLRIVSEPDHGVYDAYNKGIALATGELVGILNDDDCYAPGVLRAVGETFLQTDGLDVVTGKALVFEDLPDGRRDLLELSEQPAERLDLRNLNWATPILNARFFNARVFERWGSFDTRYRIEADLDFLVRLALARVRGAYLDTQVMWYRSHERSITLSRVDMDAGTYTKERLDILRGHLGRRLDRRDRMTLRRLHTWQCCTAVAMLPRRASVGGITRFLARGLSHDPWFVPRSVLFASSPRRRGNPWRGIDRMHLESPADLAVPN